MKASILLLGTTLAATLFGTASANDQSSANSATLGEVNFAFDSSALPLTASTQLAAAATYASEHPSVRLVLDAHADPVGAATYNVKLSIRRAESVRDQLISLGVPAEQIVLAAYGEDGAPRATYAEDRRVTVWSTREALASVVDRTFAGHGTAVTWERPLTTAQIEATPEPVASR